jgi:hypothetical protein
LFRQMCSGDKCTDFMAAPMANIQQVVYKVMDRCVQYVPVATKCDADHKRILRL